MPIFSCLEPVNMSPYMAEGALQQELRLFRWDIILDYLGGPRAITRAPVRGRQRARIRVECHGGSTDWRDVTGSQEMLAASRSWKFSPGVSRGNHSCQYFDFNLVGLILGFGPPELPENKLVRF